MENSQNIDNYHAKLDGKMKEWSADADKVTAAAKAAGADAETKLRDAVADIKTKETAARTRLTEFGAAAKDKRDGLKAGIETAYTDFSAAVDKARGLPH